MGIEGWYYLHENGDLIYKRELGGTAADIRESSFARCMWPMDPSDRMGAWNIAVEGLALGAKPERVADLAGKWMLTDTDAAHYAERLGVTLDMDGDAWCAKQPGFVDLQTSIAGFGTTALEALAALARLVKVPAGTMWRTTLADKCEALARCNGGAA